MEPKDKKDILDVIAKAKNEISLEHKTSPSAIETEELSEISDSLSKSIAPLIEMGSSLKTKLEKKKAHLQEKAASNGYVLLSSFVTEYNVKPTIKEIDGDDILPVFLDFDNELLNQYHATLILSSNLFPHAQRQLEDGFFAYRQGLYYSAVYTVFPLIEHVVVNKGLLEDNSTKVKSVITTRLEKLEKAIEDDNLKNGDYGPIGDALYTLTVIRDMFKKFDEVEDRASLNRNLLLHGKSMRIITQADFVKIISAICGIDAFKDTE